MVQSQSRWSRRVTKLSKHCFYAMKLILFSTSIRVAAFSCLVPLLCHADNLSRLGIGVGDNPPVRRPAPTTSTSPNQPQHFDIDLTGKMTVYGAMLTSIEKPIKADYRSFSRQDYESWMFNIEKMYYVNEDGILVQRRNACLLGSHLVPEEKPFYDIPIPCKTNFVAKLRPGYNVSANGVLLPGSVRIIQHIGKNLYLGSVSKGEFLDDRDFVLELENDAIPDGETIHVGLFHTGRLYSYTTVAGANRRLEILSQNADSGEREPKIELIEPRPPTMDEVANHLRNGGHLLVIRPVAVKTEGKVTVIDMVNDICDMRIKPKTQTYKKQP